MTLIHRRKANQLSLSSLVSDYLGEMVPFAKRIDWKRFLVPLICLKTVEWSIYKWYKPPVRRLYGVKRNELIYMITKRCSDRCPKCGIWKRPEPDSERIHVDEFIRCMRSLHENLYQVTLTGGEPLLFKKDILSIAEISRELDVPMIVVTNGSLITEEFLDRYSTLDHILVISVDTLDEGKWNEFRGRSNYDTVLANIRLAGTMLGPKLRIQSVLAHETLEDISQIKAFCDERGIQHDVQPHMDFGGVWHDAKVVSEGDNDVVCAARKNICIYPNGDVVKCFDHYRIPLAREPLGNIAKEDIISILCKKHSSEVSKLMKTCNFPCKHMSCNVPPPQFKS